MPALPAGGPQMNGNSMKTTVAPKHTPLQVRFSDIPSSFEINVAGVDADDTVEVDLEDLLDDPTELCTLLENEGAAKSYWMMVALAYAKQRKPDRAIELLLRGLAVTARAAPREKLSMLTCLCWLFLWKSRESPRMPPRMYNAALLFPYYETFTAWGADESIRSKRTL